MRFLEHEGVPTERMRLSQAGAHEPRTLRLEPEQQTLNSRVDVFMLSEFAQDLVGTPEERAKRFEEQSPQPSSEKTGPAQTPTSHSQRTTDASAAETARVSSHVWEGEAPVEPPKDASPATFTGGSAGRSGESGTRTSEFQWDAPAVADRGPF
jgi:hypothetical protein